jgi:hypothetical protein
MESSVFRRNPLPAAIQEEWHAITQEVQVLISTMPQRFTALLEANGGHTRF